MGVGRWGPTRCSRARTQQPRWPRRRGARPRAGSCRGREHFAEISPELGELDESAFDELMAEDPDEALALLADMNGATDERLRALARRLAGRIMVDLARNGVAGAPLGRAPDATAARRCDGRRRPGRLDGRAGGRAPWSPAGRHVVVGRLDLGASRHRGVPAGRSVGLDARRSPGHRSARGRRRRAARADELLGGRVRPGRGRAGVPGHAPRPRRHRVGPVALARGRA